MGENPTLWSLDFAQKDGQKNRPTEGSDNSLQLIGFFLCQFLIPFFQPIWKNVCSYPCFFIASVVNGKVWCLGGGGVIIFKTPWICHCVSVMHIYYVYYRLDNELWHRTKFDLLLQANKKQFSFKNNM